MTNNMMPVVSKYYLIKNRKDWLEVNHNNYDWYVEFDWAFDHDMRSIEHWLDQIFGSENDGNWLHGNVRIFFRNKNDAMLFMITWL